MRHTSDSLSSPGTLIAASHFPTVVEIIILKNIREIFLYRNDQLSQYVTVQLLYSNVVLVKAINKALFLLNERTSVTLTVQLKNH